jgi:4-methyl-5(b-hydroxyethyl)-thiazole monophosphate biosynthesis
VKKVVLFLADDFEEIEGLTVVDVLRRAGILVTMVSVTGGKIVRGSHGIKLYADEVFENVDYDKYDAVVLPGGMPGTKRLMKNKDVNRIIKQFDMQQKLVAAICAAPSVLGEAGILTGRKASVYPGFEEHLIRAEYVKNEVVTDGHVITAPGMGKALDFALAILKYFTEEETVEAMKAEIIA